MTEERRTPDFVCNNFYELTKTIFESQLPCENIKLEWEFLGRSFVGRNLRKVSGVNHIFVDYENDGAFGTFVLGKDSMVDKYNIFFECDE